MERTSKGFTAMGDHDLAKRLTRIKAEFAIRHPDMVDIPLTGRLPGEVGLHPFLEERGIQGETLTTGGKDKQTLLTEIAALGVNIGSYVRSVIDNPAFTIQPDGQTILHVVPKIKDLGIKKSYPTTSDRDARAMELGLEAQTGEDFLHWALEHAKHANWLKLGEVVFSSMKPVADSNGNPRVLDVERDDDGVWLYAGWVRPSIRWDPGLPVAFRLRQSPEPLKS